MRSETYKTAVTAAIDSTFDIGNGLAIAAAVLEELAVVIVINDAVSRWTYLYAFCAALNSCNLEYDISVSTDVALSAGYKPFQFNGIAETSFIDIWAIFGTC